MSEILSRTVFETCLADQTEAPWEEETRMLLAHDAALRAENERLRKELQGVANHLLSMSGGAHNCAGCGFLHKQIVRALAAPPEEK